MNAPLNPAGIKAQLEKQREEAKPILPGQEGSSTAGEVGFIEDTPGSGIDRGVWEQTLPPPSLLPTTPQTPGTNNATEVLPIPKEEESLPFKEDPNMRKTDIDDLFKER